MHTTEVVVHKDGYTRAADVTYVCHHNGDPDKSDVLVSAKTGELRYELGAGDYEEVRIPFEVMQKLVADWLRSRRISQLEQANYREVLT